DFTRIAVCAEHPARTRADLRELHVQSVHRAVRRAARGLVRAQPALARGAALRDGDGTHRAGHPAGHRASQGGIAMATSASDLISKRIAELDDWRGETLSRMRKLIHEADPDVVEAWKWMGTPVFEHDGIICTGE